MMFHPQSALFLLLSLLTGTIAFSLCNRRNVFGRNLALFSEPAAEEPVTPEDDGKSSAAAPQDDILSSPAFLKKKLEVLKEDITTCDLQIDAAKALFDVNKAEFGEKIDQLNLEFDNMKSRVVAQSAGDEKSRVEVARAIVEVLDNYERAFAAVESDTDEKKEIESAYRTCHDNFMTILSDLGVSPVETIGKEFDYEVHNAVTVMPSEYEEGIVCAELQKGYVLGDSLIREAMVAVSS